MLLTRSCRWGGNGGEPGLFEQAERLNAEGVHRSRPFIQRRRGRVAALPLRKAGQAERRRVRTMTKNGFVICSSYILRRAYDGALAPSKGKKAADRGLMRHGRGFWL